MSITYNGGSGLFDDIGELIKFVNQLRASATGDAPTGGSAPIPDLPDRMDALESQLNTSGRHDILSGMPEMVDGFKDGLVGWAQLVSDKVTDRLRHKETVLAELKGLNQGASIQDVLFELYRQMEDDSETVDKTGITVGTEKSFDDSDVSTADEQITVTSHGFGPTGADVIVQFEEDESGSITGLTDGDYYTVEIIDSNTVEFQDADITGATGSNHVLKPLSGNADEDNNGNGLLPWSKELDGVTSPGAGILPCWHYAGIDSELAVAESMTLTCVSDEDSDGRSKGEEIFRWETDVPVSGGGLHWDTESSGTSKDVPTLNTYQIISNKDFESWDSNVPEGWDLDDGTAGTHVIQENTASHVYRGSSSLEFAGDGSEATLQVSQTLPVGLLQPNRLYCLAVLVQGASGIASGDLTIQFESPSGDYTAASDEKITLSSAELAAQTAFELEYFYLLAPTEIPDDMELVIKVENTLTDSKWVWIDSLAFGPVEYGNGINVALVAGSDQFVRGDRFTLSVSNDESGTIQEFFRKKYRVQLPSDGTGSETIDDAIAE